MKPIRLPGPLKNLNKKVLIGLSALLLILSASGLYAAFFSKDMETLGPSSYSLLEKEGFASTVQVQGTIDTAKDLEVYTNQTAPVKEIYVKENETVTEGQVLALLDDSNLRKQIAVKEALVGVSARSAAAQIQAAENRYNAARRALTQGTNAALVSADTSVHIAKRNWDSAEKAYQDFVRSIQEGYHPELSGQDTAAEGTQGSLRNAQTAYDNAKAEVTRNQEKLAQAQKDKAHYNSERDRLRSEVNKVQTELSDAQRKLAEEQGAAGSREGVEATINQAISSRDHIQSQIAQLDPADPMVADLQRELQRQNDTIAIQKDYLNKLSSGSVSSAASKVNDLSTKLNNLNNDLAQAESEYAKAVANIDAYENAKAGLDQAVDTAKLNLETSLTQSKRNDTSTSRTKANLKDQTSTLRASADAAKEAYDDALRAQRAAQAGAQDEVQSLADSLNTTIASGDDSASLVELANLWKDLEEMTIKAPVAGVVTRVSAQQGMIPSGPLFKIESINDLLIETDLKEFDVNSVKEGMRVEIKTDATGDQTFSGKVVSIAPVSSKHADKGATSMGSTDTGGQPTFKTIIAINGKPTQLKAGMEARLTIFLSEEDSVIAVPYASVYENKEGKSAVLVARPSEGRGQGRHKLQEVIVEPGLENDLAVVVTGDLADGDKIILNPGDYADGQEVLISETDPVKP